MKQELVTIKVKPEDRAKIKSLSKTTGIKQYEVVSALLEIDEY